MTQTTRFKIERGIPMPLRTHGGDNQYNCGHGHVEIYPWKDMNIGDSFFVSSHDEDAKDVSARLGGAASVAKKRHGFRFSRRTYSNGVRVWRTK